MHNHWLLNINNIILFTLLFYYYFKIFNDKKAKTLIHITGLISIIFLNMVIIFDQGIYILATHAVVPITLIIAIISFFYMRNYIEENDTPPFQNFNFILSALILFDYSVSIPKVSLMSWYVYSNPDIYKYFSIVGQFLHLFWDLSLIAALLWKRRITRLSF
jgi:hypothetical protein